MHLKTGVLGTTKFVGTAIGASGTGAKHLFGLIVKKIGVGRWGQHHYALYVNHVVDNAHRGVRVMADSAASPW